MLLAVVLVAPQLLYPPLTDRELNDQKVTLGKERIELKREQAKLQNDARGTLLSGLTGGVVLLGAFFTWRLGATVHASANGIQADHLASPSTAVCRGSTIRS